MNRKKKKECKGSDREGLGVGVVGRASDASGVLGVDLGSDNHFIILSRHENAYPSGVSYDYLNVPEDVFEEFEDAPSAGQFMNAVIKPTYACA